MPASHYSSELIQDVIVQTTGIQPLQIQRLNKQEVLIEFNHDVDVE